MKNTTNPLVSVVMPAYNVEKYVAEAIESILGQTFEDFELIILDDASTDNTWEVVKRYARQDKGIIPIRNAQNLYIAGNRNEGISLARGKYIVWQDADDVSLPERIEKLVEFMENNPDVGICGSYLQSFVSNKDLDVRKYAADDKTLRKNIFKYSPVAQPAAIVRKSCFDELGLFNLEYPAAEDIDFSFRIGTKYRFANIPEVLLRYREHPGSATHIALRKQIKNTLKIRRRYARGFGYFRSNPDVRRGEERKEDSKGGYSFGRNWGFKAPSAKPQGGASEAGVYYYKMGFSDYLAYLASWLAQFLPAGIVISLFKLLRSFINKT